MVRNLMWSGGLLLPLMLLARGQPWAPLAGLLALLGSLCSLVFSREVEAGRARVVHLQIFGLLFATVIVNALLISDREWGLCLVCLGFSQFLAAILINGLVDGLDPVATVALPLSSLLAGLRWQMANVPAWQAVALGWAPYLALALLVWPLARKLNRIPFAHEKERRRLWTIGWALSLAVNLACFLV